MINIKNQVPGIYYEASRDFQVLGHLYEVILNYVKTNADMLYLLPNGIEEDTRATELLATTLGFKLRRNYDKAQLAALVSIFPQLLKIKGTIKAVELAGNALVKASGVPGTFSIDTDKLATEHILVIKIPIELSDITLFLDLLPYILPFGLRINIIRNTVIKQELTTPAGVMAVMRNAFASMTTNHGRTAPHARHPLGLANITMMKDSAGNNTDTLVVGYSNSNFINPDTHEVIAGQLGASPIIAFDPLEGSLDANAQSEEETT